MTQSDSRSDTGIVKIHKNAIISVSSIAAMETDGVKSIGSLKKGLPALLEKITGDKIKVDFDKNGEIRLEIPLIIKYGFNIPQVADTVQENVRNALEKTTNLSVKDINIIVQGIERG